MIVHVRGGCVAQLVRVIVGQPFRLGYLFDGPADAAHVQPFPAFMRANTEQQCIGFRSHLLQ